MASPSLTCRRATRFFSPSRWRGPRCWERSDIFIGVNALDYSGYPDCRPEFIRAFETMSNLATRTGVEGTTHIHIRTPLIEMTKAEIVKLGRELSVPFELTHSCYDPDAAGRPCGACDSCLLRAKGFREAGDRRDPALNCTADHAYRRNFLFRAGRRDAGGRAFGVCTHQRMQSALLVVRHALHVVASGRRRDERGGDPRTRRRVSRRTARGDYRRRADDRARASSNSRSGLRERELHITIETAGTVFAPVVCDLMSISPKLANSTPEGEFRRSSRTAAHAALRAAPAHFASYDVSAQIRSVAAGGYRGSAHHRRADRSHALRMWF